MCKEATDNPTERPPTIEEFIQSALKRVDERGDIDPDPRTLAIVKTKLQEALLWASKVYDPFK